MKYCTRPNLEQTVKICSALTFMGFMTATFVIVRHDIFDHFNQKLFERVEQEELKWRDFPAISLCLHPYRSFYSWKENITIAFTDAKVLDRDSVKYATILKENQWTNVVMNGSVWTGATIRISLKDLLVPHFSYKQNAVQSYDWADFYFWQRQVG